MQKKVESHKSHRIAGAGRDSFYPLLFLDATIHGANRYTFPVGRENITPVWVILGRIKYTAPETCVVACSIIEMSVHRVSDGNESQHHLNVLRLQSPVLLLIYTEQSVDVSKNE